jgi:hypothetical protein
MSIFDSEPTRSDRDRSAKLTWELGPTVSFHGEPCTAVAQLFVYHDRDRKRFVATVQRIDISPIGSEMFTIGKNTAVNLASTPCARFSAKAFDAAVRAALSALRVRADEPEVQAVANPASPA